MSISITRREVRWVMYAVPVLILGLATFSILMNVAHLSNCPSEASTAKENTLKMSVMEQRLMTLEQELVENTLLLEQFLQALDKKFEALKLVHMPDVQQRSHQDAVDISQHLAKGNPPPILPSKQASFQVDNDPLSFGQEVETAFLWKNSEYGGDAAPISKPDSAGDNEFNDGKEWMAQWAGGEDTGSDLIEDWDFEDLYMGDEGKGEVKDEKQIQKGCLEWKTLHNVIPNLSWGTLPLDVQEKWIQSNCDFWVEQPLLS